MMSRAAFPCVAVAAAAVLLGGCSSTSSTSSSADSGGFGSSFKNLVLFGSTTAPAPTGSGATSLEGADCPPVSIADGGAALRTLASRSAEASAVASQISISDIARECIATADGGILVKIGVQGRALLGPGGGSARFDTPVRFVLKRGSTVIASRVRRVSAAVTANEPQAFFTVVEDGLVAPAGSGEFEIEVGLGSAGAADQGPARARRKRS